MIRVTCSMLLMVLMCAFLVYVYPRSLLLYARISLRIWSSLDKTLDDNELNPNTPPVCILIPDSFSKILSNSGLGLFILAQTICKGVNPATSSDKFRSIGYKNFKDSIILTISFWFLRQAAIKIVSPSKLLVLGLPFNL